METMETPTQMTTGVAQNVGAQTASFGNEADMRIGNGIPEGVSGEEINPVILNVSEESEEIETSESNSAEPLLQSAKNEGFETALVRLASGDFEQDSEEKQEHAGEDSQEAEGSNEEADEEILEIPEDEIPLSEQISILEEKVEVLKAETLSLSEKIKSIDNTQKIPIEVVLGLLALLQKLAEEEEDEVKKVNMLEVIFNFLVFFMKEIFVPKDENEKTQQVEKVAPKKKSKVSSGQVLEILRTLKKESTPQPSITPHIEKTAA